MTAQEQMRKMLDQLMGSGRDGESQFSLLIYSVLVNSSSYQLDGTDLE